MSRRTQRGFTLMEVVIAVTIVAMMGALVSAAFTTSFKAKEVVEAEAERYRMIRTAMNRMTREISAAFISDRYDSRRYRDQNERPTNFIGERDSLLFTSLANQRLYADAKESDQMVVEYSVKSSPSEDKAARGRTDLVRRVNPILEERMDRGGTEDILFEGIQKIEFQYWDAERKEWDDEWDTRRVERKSILPTRVKVTIFATDENKKEVQYTTQTRIMLNTELPRY